MPTLSYPRYVPWDTRRDETQEARDNFAAYLADGRAAALHDTNHPDHEQAVCDMLMCLDKADVISRSRREIASLQRQLRDARQFHHRECSRLRATVKSAGQWWDMCVAASRNGRKTIRLDQMPEPAPSDTAGDDYNVGSDKVIDYLG